jgi:hypothetical protein|tara:strand:- start:6418 stop:6552 length:135 start_codon:yes stop_codon:yes gene_type:complete
MVVPMYETSLLMSGMFVGLLLGVSVAAIFKKGSNSPQPVYLVKE